MKINTNISALMATGNLHRTEDKITTSLTRLSSGYRINKAAALLKAGNLSVGEVAYSTGFSDQLYFSRVFKRHMGVPPSRYLNQKKNESTS